MAQYALLFDKDDEPTVRVVVMVYDPQVHPELSWRYLTQWGGGKIPSGETFRVDPSETDYEILPCPEQLVDGILALRQHLTSEAWERRALWIVMGEDFVNDLDLDWENDDGDL